MVLLTLLACHEPPDTAVPTDEPLGTDATLAELTLGGQALTPVFDPAVFAYVVRGVGSAAAVVARPTDERASVETRRLTVDGGELPALTGDWTIATNEMLVFDVTSEDGNEHTTTQVLALPDDFPTLEVETSGEVRDGYLFLGLIDSAPGDGTAHFSAILDARGTPVWTRKGSAVSWDFRVSGAGRVTYAATEPPLFENTGTVLDETWSDAVLVTEPTNLAGATMSLDVHEFAELDDGDLLITAVHAGLMDLSSIGGTGTDRVLHNVFQVRSPEDAIVFEWSTDGVIDPLTMPFLTYDEPHNAWEYAHLNSVGVDPDDGHWIVSLRIPDQVVKLDRDTGEVIWRLGGLGSDFVFVGDDGIPGHAGFYGQHSARALPGGRLLVYDNALARQRTGPLSDQQIDITTTGPSRGVEYQLDVADGTATRLAEFALPGSESTVAGGSVQRLPNGDTLVGWGDLPAQGQAGPLLTWFDPLGAVVFELALAEPSWTYRAWWHDRDVDGWIPEDLALLTP